MLKLNLPEFDYRLENRGGKLFIFDAIRKKFVHLSPEEWVRQHFLHLMIRHLGYPPALMRVESGLKYNDLRKRSDLLIYDSQLKPLVLVECKAPHVSVGDKTVEQIATYNKICQAPLIIMTNGMKTYAVQREKESETFEMIQEIPSYQQLLDSI